MKKIIILTGNELRHTYIRKAIALFDGIDVIKSYCEKKPELKTESILQDSHLEARENSEKDFFEAFVSMTSDLSNPLFLEQGEVNHTEHVQDIIKLNPDLLVAFGCSLIKGELLQHFKGNFLNVHLGLSPYYRGTGTNFWPLVNNEPEYVGATFMHIDAGIDTGKIIHQIRARIYKGDGPHQIGNRVILDIPAIYAQLIKNPKSLKFSETIESYREEKLYRRKDFSTKATEDIYNNFKNDMINCYLSNKDQRDSGVPIIQNPMIKN